MNYLYKQISENETYCFNLELNTELNEKETTIINRLLDITNTEINRLEYIEYGPYPSIETPWCTNVLNIFRKCGIKAISRIERSILIKASQFNPEMVDKMLETIYKTPLETFIIDKEIESPYIVNDIKNHNKEKGLGFDEADIEYYQKILKYPTNVELYDLAQSNSEHSRHWFFNGIYKLEDKIIITSLFQNIKETQTKQTNSLIAFKDNASAINGYEINTIIPNQNKIYITRNVKYNPTLTAETHNFPTGIAPYPGAATGVGGRIRDNQAIGRGGLIIAGTAGYCVGNIDEKESKYYKKNLKTLIEASNGASDYGNMIGEPIIQGFCRSFGLTLIQRENTRYGNIHSERIEWVKPIMFSAGIGQIDERHLEKEKPEKGMLIVRLGGPAYRIGIGGGMASSKNQNKDEENKDYDAVQRGDPEMENKLNRVIRTCIELGEDNPIMSIHDQGAGGMGNVTKEIVYPSGGKVYIRKVILGDKTM